MRDVRGYQQPQASGTDSVRQPDGPDGRQVHLRQQQPADQHDRVAPDHRPPVADVPRHRTQDQATDRGPQEVARDRVHVPTGIVRLAAVTVVSVCPRQSGGRRVPRKRRADHHAAQTGCEHTSQVN